MARGIGPAPCFVQERLPGFVGQPAPFPVRAGILPAVVEEADVVVLLLRRFDFPFDEFVQLLKIGRQFRRDFEIPLNILINSVSCGRN